MKDKKTKRKMTVLEAIKTYQVPGCVVEFDPKTYEKELPSNGVGWRRCTSGCNVNIMGEFLPIYLGMPKGFNQIGVLDQEYFRMRIFDSWDDVNKHWAYNMYNVPVWKYLDEHGNTLVRGLCPRINLPFLHVILGDCRDKIKCLEVTNADIAGMD